MLHKIGYTVLFLLTLLYGCGVTKIKTSCLRGVSESKVSSKREILHQIDSVYKSTSNGKFKKIVGSSCIDDTIIEVKVLNTLSIYDLFYFNNNIHLIEVKHELKDVY
jgi:hypothetical protein